MACTITEIKNNKLKLEEIKMLNDSKIKGIDPPLPSNYNFFLLVVGTPGSGKSSLWINLITKKEKNTYYKKFDKIFIFSNSFKTISTTIHLPKDRIFDGLSELEEVVKTIEDTADRCLFIIDDCVSETKADPAFLKFIYNRRHLAGGISIIFTTQVYNKIPLAIRKASSDIILFSTGNKREIASIYADFVNIPEKAFEEVVQHCFTGKHDFMMFNGDTNTFYKNFNLLQLDF